MITDIERQASKRIAANLRLIKEMRDETNDTLADKLGKDRNWTQERISGKRPLSSGQLDLFADALRVPPALVVTRDQRDILRYMAGEGPSDQEVWALRWIDGLAGQDDRELALAF